MKLAFAERRRHFLVRTQDALVQQFQSDQRLARAGVDDAPGHVLLPHRQTRPVQRFGQALHYPGDTNLIHHLRQLAATCRAKQFSAARVTHYRRFGLGKIAGFATNHHR